MTTDAAAAPPDAPRAPVTERLWRGWLAALIALYAVVQVLWVTATPLQRITLPDNLPQRPGADRSLIVGLGPDEKEHFLYLLSLANRGQIPEPSPAFRASPDDYVSYQAQHPPLFYVLGALLYRIFAGALGPSGIWFLLRAACAALGVPVILFAGRAARLAFPGRPLVALGTPAVVAFTPMLGHMMGCLSNEPLAMALTAWGWWLAVRLLRSPAPATVRDGALLGLALGLAAEARLTALMWLPAAVLVLVVAGRRGGSGSRGSGVVPALAAFWGVFALLALPWLVHNQLAYGTPFFRTFDRPTLGAGASFLDFWTGSIPPRPDHPVSLNPRYTMLYFASTAWTPYWLIKYFLPAPPGWNTQIFWQMVAVLVDAAAGILLVMHALHAREDRETPADPAGRAVLWAAGLTVAVCVLATFEQQLYADWTVVLSPGRYLVASAASSALLFAFALSTVGERRRRPDPAGDGRGGAVTALAALAAPLALAALMLAFDAYSAGLVRHFYALTPTQPAVQPIPKTTD